MLESVRPLPLVTQKIASSVLNWKAILTLCSGALAQALSQTKTQSDAIREYTGIQPLDRKLFVIAGLNSITCTLQMHVSTNGKFLMSCVFPVSTARCSWSDGLISTYSALLSAPCLPEQLLSSSANTTL